MSHLIYFSLFCNRIYYLGTIILFCCWIFLKLTGGIYKCTNGVYSDMSHAIHEDVNSSSNKYIFASHYLYWPIKCPLEYPTGFSLELLTQFYRNGIYEYLLGACFEKVRNAPNLHKLSHIPWQTLTILHTSISNIINTNRRDMIQWNKRLLLLSGLFNNLWPCNMLTLDNLLLWLTQDYAISELSSDGYISIYI
jgi:hypothetical protein